MLIQERIIHSYKSSHSLPIVIALCCAIYIVVKVLAQVIFAKWYSSQNPKKTTGIGLSSRVQQKEASSSSNGTHHRLASSCVLPVNSQQIIPTSSTKTLIEHDELRKTHEIEDIAKSQLKESQTKGRLRLKETRDLIQQVIDSIKEIKLRTQTQIQEKPAMSARFESLMDMQISNLFSKVKSKMHFTDVCLKAHDSMVKSLQTMGLDTSSYLIPDAERIQSCELTDPLKSLGYPIPEVESD